MIVRRMTLADVDAVAEIEHLSFPDPWPADDFRKELTERPFARYLVAEEDDKVIGYAGAWIALDEGDITNVAVHPDARRKGAGEMLMRGIMQYASNLGVSVLVLEVRVSNLGAQALYRKLGFQSVGLRKRYYANGEDAHLMVCDRLPPPDPDFTEAETVTE